MHNIPFFLLLSTFFAKASLQRTSEALKEKSMQQESFGKFMIMRRYKITEDCIKSCHEHFLVVSSSQAKQLKEKNCSTQHATLLPFTISSSSSTIFLSLYFAYKNIFVFFSSSINNSNAAQRILLIKNFLCNYNIILLEKYARGMEWVQLPPLHFFFVFILKLLV